MVEEVCKIYAIFMEYEDGTYRLDEDNIFATEQDAQTYLNVFKSDPEYYGTGWEYRELTVRKLSDKEGTFLLSKSEDGDYLVMDSPFFASKVDGVWKEGIHFTGYELMEYFERVKGEEQKLIRDEALKALGKLI